MLKASFSCFRGLSPAAELALWQRGCLNWQAFEHLPAGTYSTAKQKSVRRQIDAAHLALDARLADFFLNRFAAADKVRVLKEFHHRTAFLDIETTGLSNEAAVTTIAVLIGGESSVFTRGIDLEDFLTLIPRVGLFVTYNGARFDLPILRREFGIDLALPHLDLMPTLAALGYRGGQKRCEQLAGLKRSHSPGTDGAEAVNLWQRYCREHDRSALQRLILYNAEDVAMLEKLAVLAYNLSMSAYPLNIRIQALLPMDWSREDLTAAAL